MLPLYRTIPWRLLGKKEHGDGRNRAELTGTTVGGGIDRRAGDEKVGRGGLVYFAAQLLRRNCSVYVLDHRRNRGLSWLGGRFVHLPCRPVGRGRQVWVGSRHTDLVLQRLRAHTIWATTPSTSPRCGQVTPCVRGSVAAEGTGCFALYPVAISRRRWSELDAGGADLDGVATSRQHVWTINRAAIKGDLSHEGGGWGRGVGRRCDRG